MVAGKDSIHAAKLRFGMVGGGQGAFIGGVHRIAAIMDGQADFVAGALSSDPDRARASGRDLGLADDRNYGTWEEMLERELARPEGERIDWVSIVTPNHVHYPVAKAFAEAGFNVVCDKPLVHTSEQAEDLVRTVERTGVVFAVTYNYTGYPMIKQARAMVREGRLGEIRKIIVEYNQGWLTSLVEATGQKQAEWRTDPARSGAAGAIGDIGSHAENLAVTVTGLEISEICADLTAFVPGRKLDDDGNLLLRFDGGAKGVLIASQISTGEENDLRLRVYGSEGALTWHQEDPNQLHFHPEGGHRTLLTRGGPGMDEAAVRATRIPTGHPEGYLEGFANVYGSAMAAIRARRDGIEPDEYARDYPTVRDGARGVRFIERTVESSKSDAKWTKVNG